MNNKQLIIFLTSMIFFVGLIWGSAILSEKIAADLVKDMANMGYYQKIEDGKIIWVKDKR